MLSLKGITISWLKFSFLLYISYLILSYLVQVCVLTIKQVNEKCGEPLPLCLCVSYCMLEVPAVKAVVDHAALSLIAKCHSCAQLFPHWAGLRMTWWLCFMEYLQYFYEVVSTWTWQIKVWTFHLRWAGSCPHDHPNWSAAPLAQPSRIYLAKGKKAPLYTCK